ncbi:MAG: 2-isopropylmalate synthase [Firmicutes bacterium]|nr:2-isopropylmalate synthase [Bacillota bacterium]
MNVRKIFVFDTTLRDGEQTPGVSLNAAEKVEIARQLERLGVDLVEAGFPVASPGDFEAVQQVAKTLKNTAVVALARAVPKDIEAAAEALRESASPVIHTFIATSDIHIKYKLRSTPEEVLERAVAAVKLARNYSELVEFSAEDATRSDPAYLRDVFAAVIKAGAGIINIPDTVGYTTPDEFAQLITYLKENTPGIDKVRISVHCHNDLGLAVANTLKAVSVGASQVECTINGLGERAGNAALEEVVMALQTRSQLYQAQTDVNSRQIAFTSRLVSSLTGVGVQPNKAIVGKNAFAHESGIHQDGMLKNRNTYEIMTPESVGLTQSQLVLGKHSGRHAFRAHLTELGYSLNEEELNKAYQRFIELADKKKEVTDRDIQAIVEDETQKIEELYTLEYLHISSGNTTVPTATVIIKHQDELLQEAACGDGPVDAVYKAIERATGIDVYLESWSIEAATGGKDALGEVTARILADGKSYIGRGSSTDVIVASAKAYLRALNRYLQDTASNRPQRRKAAWE